MKKRPGSGTNEEPRDLGREWHSDSMPPVPPFHLSPFPPSRSRHIACMPVIIAPVANHNAFLLGLFENCPSDFSFLRMQSTPPAGGDTLWASGYELYDRLSPQFQKFFETLTATCEQPVFKSACEAGGYEIMSPRGSPLNIDFQFAPSHPVIRTHPVTGWKSLFAGVGLHVSRIDGVTSYEDSLIRDYVMRLVTRNHDCIARMHWTRGACAIWSNECTLHAATVSHVSTPFSASPFCIWYRVLTKATARHASRRGHPDGRACLGHWRRTILGPGKHGEKGGTGIAAGLSITLIKCGMRTNECYG